MVHMAALIMLMAGFVGLRLLGAKISLLAFIAASVIGGGVAFIWTVYMVGKDDCRADRDALFNNLK